jgi:hypothetical protein
MLKPITVAGVMLSVALPVTAQTTSNSQEIGSLLYKTASAYQGAGTDGLKNMATDAALSVANEQLNQKAQEFLNQGFTTFDVQLSYFDDELTVELMSVYGLRRTKDSFLFNQTSVVNYDGRTTINLGLGYRAYTPSRQSILGVNAFYDHELSSDHNRFGVGLEWLGRNFALRSNYYRAISDEIFYDGAYESALDGLDYKLSWILPTTYPVEIFAQGYEWSDSTDYKEEGHKVGVSGNLTRSMIYTLGYDKQKDGLEEGFVTLSYAFGPAKRQIGAPLEVQMYQPVQRENRIKKKVRKIGVTTSRF